MNSDEWLKTSDFIARTDWGGCTVVGILKKEDQQLLFLDVKDALLRMIDSDPVQVLINPPTGVDMEWVERNSGQSAPAGAVVGGQICADGGPVFVVKKDDLTGYYDMNSECTRIYSETDDKCVTKSQYLTFNREGKITPYIF